MRRLAVVSLAPMAAAVFAVAACDSAGGGAASPGGSGTAEVSAPASPTVRPSLVVSENTKQVCDAINQAVAEGASAFGGDLGAFAGHLAGGNKTEAEKSRASAVGRLKTLAGKIRTAAASAEDSEVQAAAQHTADQISALASDPTLLSNVKKATDLAPVIEKLTRATDEMNKVCV
jgi:hypothetical protein